MEREIPRVVVEAITAVPRFGNPSSNPKRRANRRDAEFAEQAQSLVQVAANSPSSASLRSKSFCVGAFLEKRQTLRERLEIICIQLSGPIKTSIASRERDSMRS